MQFFFCGCAKIKVAAIWLLPVIRLKHVVQTLHAAHKPRHNPPVPSHPHKPNTPGQGTPHEGGSRALIFIGIVKPKRHHRL